MVALMAGMQFISRLAYAVGKMIDLASDHTVSCGRWQLPQNPNFELGRLKSGLLQGIEMVASGAKLAFLLLSVCVFLMLTLR